MLILVGMENLPKALQYTLFISLILCVSLTLIIG